MSDLPVSPKRSDSKTFASALKQAVDIATYRSASRTSLGGTARRQALLLLYLYAL